MGKTSLEPTWPNVAGQLRLPKPLLLEELYQTDDELYIAMFAEYELKANQMKTLEESYPDRKTKKQTIALTGEAQKKRSVPLLIKIDYKTQLYRVLSYSCTKCGKENNLEGHHIVYGRGFGLKSPIVVLCRSCHSKITSLNTRAVRLLTRYGKWKSLTDEQRVFIFNKIFMFYSFEGVRRFPKGKLKTILVNAGFIPELNKVVHVDFKNRN